MQVPEHLTRGKTHDFVRELRGFIESKRPRIVLDCSQVRSIDSAGVQALLYCLEETLKRDGDLKLASLSAEAEVILELTRVARIFETFSTSDEAVRSFDAISPADLPHEVRTYRAAFETLRAVKETG
jgi:anti-sigma B factor antagonist